MHRVGRTAWILNRCGLKTMTKNSFRELFVRALNGAAENAESKLGKPIPRSYLIELHAPPVGGGVVTVDEALDCIYLGSDRFYRIIDVAIKELLPGKSLAFVRVSGHKPAAFDQTWAPSAAGPFKQIISETIEDHSITT
jgi:hypothetical protein